MNEKMKEALSKIGDANRIIKEEWDKDKDNHQAAGCYKALNAVIMVIQEDKTKPEKTEEYYVFSRLSEAISWLAEFYGIPFAEAAELGGLRHYLTKS